VSATCRFFLLIIIYLFLSSSVVYCQNNPYVFRHITTEDGLSGNDVRNIIQDNKGFIWVATNNGLQKYDGYSFTSYHHNPVDFESISSDNLLVLSKDNHDIIWTISFLAGINRFDPVSTKCIRINDLNSESFEHLFLPNALCRDRNDNMWLIASKSIACFNSANKKLTFPEKILPKEFNGYFMDAQYDSVKNQLWLADVKNGVCMYDLGKNIFYNHDHNPGNIRIFNVKCNAIKVLLDHSGNLWVHGNDGFLTKYNLTSNTSVNYFLYELGSRIIRLKNKQVHFQYQPIFISTMNSDSQGNIWIAAGTKGLLQYIPAQDSFRSIPSVSTFTNGLNFNTDIHCIFQDKEGNIWIGTDNGINVFNPLRQRFHFFDNNPFNSVTGSRNETMDFVQTKNGDVWVATWGSGLNVFDSTLNAKKHFGYKPDDAYTIPVPGNLVWAVLKYGPDSVVIGYQAGLLSTVNTQSFLFTHYKPKNLEQTTIMNMNADKQKNIWLSLFSGIGRWNAHDINAVRYNNFIPYRGVSKATASDILPDDSGHLWVGTLGLGLQKFDPESNRFTEIFTPEKTGTQSISSAMINCLISLSDSTIAIGTGSGGIDIFNVHNKHFLSINTTDGLPSNNISALYFIPPYTLWASTGSMLSKINLNNKHISSFGSGDGIRNLDFSNCHRMYMLRDGKLLAGYKGGFLYFYPDSIKEASAPSNVSITGIKVLDRVLPVDSLLQKTDTVIFSYKQNFLTIQYASLSYLEANRINYFYRLTGIDKTWVSGNSERLVTYTNLQPGTYIFEVRCENGDGIGCKNTSRIVVIITPPFWQTAWFRILVISALIISLYLLYRYRVNQIFQMQHMRNEISKDLHDDVGSTLSSISILSQVAKNKIGEGEEEQSSSIMTRINNSAQEMVEKMGDIVWAVNSRNDSFQDLIVRLRTAFLETCVSRSIRLYFTCDAMLEKRTIPMQIRKNIYLICKEAINNAIKYSGGDQIHVSFSVRYAGMEIMIADNGKGLGPEKLGEGNGLLNMRSRAEEMKALIKIQSTENGVSVILDMNIPKNR
jgi:ligand-binding sensor domain-containing protein/two-component sensor histidine kinase